MTLRSVAKIAHPAPQPGTGILHPFPSRELSHLDPFVFLDTGAPMQLGAGDIYVGPHSHRGVQPVSLLFRGRIEHRDSLGNDRTISSGGMQWLVAGSGALHEEVLNGDDDGVFHMAQLWVNVPGSMKMDPPEHHAVDAADVPVVTPAPGVSVRLYAGEVAGSVGPASLPTPVLVAHVILDSGSEVTIPAQRDWTASFCVVAGSVSTVGHNHLGEGATPIFADDGDAISVGSQNGGEILLMIGEPIGEPIAMGGGFVMNSAEEINQAFEDEAAGLLGTLAASR